MTREDVLRALGHIIEPGTKIRMVDLGFVRDIMVKPDQIALTLILLSEDEPMKDALIGDVRSALQEAGAASVHIRTRAASDFERGEIMSRVNQGEGNADTHSHSKAPASAPQKPGAVSPAQFLNDIMNPESGTVFIAIASGKGGVGKSTVTVNLAASLARLGKKVGIIDADIYGFSVPDMMGIEERPQLDGGRIVPIERFGVKVMSMGFFVEDNAPIIWRGPMLGKMLRNFFAEVKWGELDYLLLDLPPGTGDIALDIHQLIPQTKEIIVTTPHATAAFVAARAGAMAIHTKHELLGIVENMAYYECSSCGNKDYVFGRGGGGKLAAELHTELLAQIPLGTPDNHPSEREYSPSIYKQESSIGKLYMELAQRVVATAAK